VVAAPALSTERREKPWERVSAVRDVMTGPRKQQG
jgi:hypothetical protein